MPFESLPGLFWFLLPIAAASGFYFAKYQVDGATKTRGGHRFAPDYFKGLNYLLNEQQDKAIEVFVRLLEVEPDTVETHFALGNLFRRRGEVDRAIRIHQNLIARPSLDRTYRQLALLELGIDYMRSGLLDRAEGLFQRLVDQDMHKPQALRNLLDIYQQEKDWAKCIETCLQLERVSGEDMSRQVGQFYCERAQAALEAGDQRLALEYLRSATVKNPRCARASLMEGRNALEQGRFDDALSHFKRIPKQDPDLVSEVIPGLVACYRAMGKTEALASHLDDIKRNYPTVRATLTKAELLAESQGLDSAISYIIKDLREQPSVRGLDRLIDYGIKRADAKTRESLVVLKDFTARLMETKPTYRCNRCGFESKAINWQCPSCKHWESVRPIHGIEGQ